MKPAGGKDAETLMVMEGVRLRPRVQRAPEGRIEVETNQIKMTQHCATMPNLTSPLPADPLRKSADARTKRRTEWAN